MPSIQALTALRTVQHEVADYAHGSQRDRDLYLYAAAQRTSLHPRARLRAHTAPTRYMLNKIMHRARSCVQT